jgi:hypothetical protein
VELLAKQKKTWNDLSGLQSGEDTGYRPEDDEPDGDGATIASNGPAALDLIRYILERHLHLKEHQLIALTLWIATFPSPRGSRSCRRSQDAARRRS